jgi:hypothetical protein
MQQLKIVTLWLVWLLTEMDTDDLIRKTLKSVKNIKGQWPCWCTVLIIVSLYLIIYLNLLKILVWPETEKIDAKNEFLLVMYIYRAHFILQEIWSIIFNWYWDSFLYFLCYCWNVTLPVHFNCIHKNRDT